MLDHHFGFGIQNWITEHVHSIDGKISNDFRSYYSITLFYANYDSILLLFKLKKYLSYNY